MNNIVEATDLTIRLGDLILFDKINFGIEGSKITVILGPNGTGKTTILKTLADIIKPTKGRVKKKSKSIFYLPQKITYPKDITLFEYLSSIFFNKSWKWYLNSEEKENIAEVLANLELTDKCDIKIEYLSAGEIQKANIALGLLSGADLLLLDEPTSNMDLVNQMKILDILKQLKNGNITTVVILHDLNLASNYGDNFIGINKTREILCAKKEEFFSSSVLEQLYNLNFKVVSGEESIFIQTFS